ncbi:MAG: hypothetical protein DBY17_08740 [Oscillospiraceae bacterium]|nr:MAG: hypothetical protein DBY17_08740 [Oscillospiraceae bacterium]
MNNYTANKELKAVLDAFAAEYKAASETSRIAFMQSMKGGDTIPEPGHLYGNDAKEAFDRKCTELRARAAAVMDTLTAEAQAQLYAAPDRECAAVVDVLRGRTNVTQEEAYGLLVKYGYNALTYRAIASAAAANGMKVDDCPQQARLDALKELQTDLARTITTQSAEVGHATEGFIEMFKMKIDDVLPA